MTINNKEISKLPAPADDFFRQWRDFMYSGKVSFNRGDSPVHGMDHYERVLYHALAVGFEEFGADNQTLEILAHAAVFHDSRRLDDEFDTGHGARAAAYYTRFCGTDSGVVYHPETDIAIRYHDLPDELGLEAIRSRFSDAAAKRALAVFKVFKDADALDRWRLGNKGLDTRFLRTDAARSMVDTARELVAATAAYDITDMERRIASRSDRSHAMLLIVDPQTDFVDGSLPVAGARVAITALAEYVRTQGDGYAAVVVSVDRHPADHCSFAGNGGIWPRHCVAGSEGCGIWPPLARALETLPKGFTVLAKGTDIDREEYSLFANKAAASELDAIVAAHNISRIDVCGLAGDICVRNTLADGSAIYGKERFCVLRSFTASTDGGHALNELIESEKLCAV